ncbi:hypothetical protein ACVWZV_004485 [Bradyrhizobium sp. GM5.1]
MTNTTTKPDCLQPAANMAGDLFDKWFDPLEAEVRARSLQRQRNETPQSAYSLVGRTPSPFATDTLSQSSFCNSPIRRCLK